MATFERNLRVRAPFEDVWKFHSTIDGLLSLTPGWANLRVEAVQRPDGDTGDVLTVGTRIRMSVRPFGVGPRQRWVSRITEREEGDGYAYFADVMEEGPFPEWEHTHTFYADGDDTLARDHVEYRTPVGGIADEVAGLFFDPMFRYRHRRTRELLERP
ncbi:SRPBCC family protein [Halobacterium wangiae]|uniref:SRPBCC family protein n=1 Tax=Halobacterium wangiae TaxID=2902623 RepID=UPI001E592BD5|nr:SRPBCC family protein [Halobacterium wangiae]